MSICSELAQLDDLEVEEADVTRIRLILSLRHAATASKAVTLVMTPERARELAADLEELTMLHMVPPTGDKG